MNDTNDGRLERSMDRLATGEWVLLAKREKGLVDELVEGVRDLGHNAVAKRGSMGWWVRDLTIASGR